ncbi:GSCFA domain-containing protein [Jiella sp. CQZ9-1]|uniref:GSCFA domain-containing protein n=2 Tax=Jiella flava TaxID=2816857 RepID=A0A939FV53_9HYPH|nr:GSCFA domain-containing protein [Jiella flava]
MQSFIQHSRAPTFCLAAPAPKADEDHILRGAETPFREAGIENVGVTPAPVRLKLWELQQRTLTEFCAEIGVKFLPNPEGTRNADGFLEPAYYGRDSSHANVAYGGLVVEQLLAESSATVPVRPQRGARFRRVSGAGLLRVGRQLSQCRLWRFRHSAAARRVERNHEFKGFAIAKTDHPYRHLPDTAFWKRSVAKPAASEVDPVTGFDLKIGPQTRVATAGSCFAQHIARHLQKSGFLYYVAEDGHPIIPEPIRRANNYGTFSARYGNVYTARQLRQLIERAEGEFTPSEAAWIDPDGTVRDPFRPAIQPGNFVSVEEMMADRAQHLAIVRAMFQSLDVFVFTLGLTECWRSKADGAVFPLCPGVEGGTFDPERYEFYNQPVADVVADMEAVIAYLKRVNPKAEIVLTVSPVPLMATAAPDQHVLSATTYSKSVLRVAAQTLDEGHANVHYFPSYEIITGAFNRGAYYAGDLRNVTENGVSHVMRLFLKHATDTRAQNAPVQAPPQNQGDANEAFKRAAEKFVEVECEEAALDR